MSLGAGVFDSHGANGFLLVEAAEAEDLLESGRSFFSTLWIINAERYSGMFLWLTYVGVAKALFLNSSRSLNSAESIIYQNILWAK